MPKVNTVNNLDTGLVARTNWNEALKGVDTNATLTGDGNAGNELAVVVDNDCNLPTDSPIIPPSVQAVKCYVENAAQVGGFQRSYSFRSRSGTSGLNYVSGYYLADSSDITLSDGNTIGLWGDSNVGYGAHFFVVAGGAATTAGTTVTLTVSGTSIDDNGVRVPGDSEIIVADATLASVNQYFETVKKWLGTIQFTLSSDGTPFEWTFNYGFTKYEDAANQDFQVVFFEAVGLANGNDANFNIELLHHNAIGWTYAAAGFIPGNGSIAEWATDYAPERQISAGVEFAYKRVNLSETIFGSLAEGVIVRITTTSNNSVANLDIHLTGNLL